MNINLRIMDGETADFIPNTSIEIKFSSSDEKSYQIIRLKSDDIGKFMMICEPSSDEYCRFSISISKDGYTNEILDGALWNLYSFDKEIYLDKTDFE